MEDIEAVEIKNMLRELRQAGVKYPRSAARLSLFLDFMAGKEVTQQFYSKVWGWHRRDVVNFMEAQGLQLRKINPAAYKTKSLLMLKDGHKKHPLFADLTQNMDIKNEETDINCALNGQKNSNDSDDLTPDSDINCALNGQNHENTNISGHKISSDNGGLGENEHTATVVDVVVEENQQPISKSCDQRSDDCKQELMQWARDMTACHVKLGKYIPYPTKYAKSLVKNKTELTADDIQELELLQYQVDNKTNTGGVNHGNHAGNGTRASRNGLQGGRLEGRLDEWRRWRKEQRAGVTTPRLV